MKTFMLTLSILVLAVTLGGCLLDYPLKQQGTTVPEKLDDGWAVSSPGAENMYELLLQEVNRMFYDDDQFYNALALLILRNDRIVFETYSRGFEDRERLQHVQSAAKSITSLAFGIIRDQGYFPDLDATLASFMPEKFKDIPVKRGITIRHLLTMRSGISFDNDDFSVELYGDRPCDPISCILQKPLYANPGDTFYYRDCDPHLLSSLVGKVTGKTLESWAREYLFQRIDIDSYHWEKDPAGATMGAYDST